MERPAKYVKDKVVKVDTKDTRTTSLLLLLTLNRFHTLFWFSIVHFEQVHAGWVGPTQVLKLIAARQGFAMVKWVKVFKNGLSKICGRQSCFKQTMPLQFFKSCVP